MIFFQTQFLNIHLTLCEHGWFSQSRSHIYVYIYMLNKNTPGVKKSEAKSEAPVSSYSYMRLKIVISD